MPFVLSIPQIESVWRLGAGRRRKTLLKNLGTECQRSPKICAEPTSPLLWYLLSALPLALEIIPLTRIFSKCLTCSWHMLSSG
jgi:hypothetical protein